MDLTVHLGVRPWEWGTLALLDAYMMLLAADAIRARARNHP